MGAFDPLHLQVDDALIHDMLADYGDRARQRMLQYLPPKQFLPWLYGPMAEYPLRSGKMLRSALCLAACGTWGGKPDDALDCAASIELLHNALLVHDDIEDESDERRGTPALHRQVGVPLALNAGDALGLLALRPLRQAAATLGPKLGARLADETERVAWESAEGQALELGWQHERRTDVSEADYLRMVMQKTCWLTTIHPLRSGCLIGSRGRCDPHPLIRVGFLFGAAFQIQDDLLNLTPGPQYGKEVDGDLREGKRTLLVVQALATAGPRDRQRLVRFFQADRMARDEDEVRWVHRLLVRLGATRHAQQVANSLAGAALCEFDHLCAHLPPGQDRRFIRQLMLWVVQRTH